MDYKISIIIAVYNGEKFIQRSFDSLKRQTIGFENLQVIYADDCSTDNSVNVITELMRQHPNIELVKLPQNSGADGAPRNEAYKHMKAKYFMILDVDDEYDDDACRSLYDAIETHNTDFALGYNGLYDADGNEIYDKYERYNELQEKRYTFPEDLFVFIPSGIEFWTIIYRTEIHNRANLKHPVGIPGSDTYYRIKYFFESKSAYYTDKQIYKYYKHEDSISHKKSKPKKYFIDICYSYELCYDLFAEYNHLDLFGSFITNVLPHFTNFMLDGDFDDTEINDIFNSWYWIFDYYKKHNLDYRSEYAKIFGAVYNTPERVEMFKLIKTIRDTHQQTTENYSKVVVDLTGHIEDMYKSYSWKIGNFIIKPFSFFKREK